VVAIAWVFWIAALSVIAGIFWVLWRYAEKIEKEEQFEEQWKGFIAQQWEIDPNQGIYWTQYYENLRR
jgi:hypothetical protein